MRVKDKFQEWKHEIEADRKKMEGASKKKKLEFFWMYYKIPLFLVIVAVLSVSSILYSQFKKEDYSFCALLVNSLSDDYVEEDDDAIEAAFREYAGIDPEESEVYIYTGLSFEYDAEDSLSSAYLEIFESYILSDSMDACVLTTDLFDSYVSQSAFADLTGVLSEEQLAEYADLLVYDDDGTAVGVGVSNFAVIEEYELYTGEEDAIFGVLYNSPHPDRAAAFLDYLAGDAA